MSQDQGDVVVLFVGAEARDFVDDGGQRGERRKRTVPLQRFKQAWLPKFISRGVEGFGDAVSVEREGVTGRELALAEFAIPFFENAEDRGSGIEVLDRGVGAEKKCGKMASIGVAQKALGVVVFREEKCGEGAVCGVFAEKLVDGAH